MTVDLMLYGIATSALIGIAGLMVEYAAAQASLPRRWGWIATLLVSVSLPAVMILKAPPSVSVPSPAVWMPPVPAPVRTLLPQASHKEVSSPLLAATSATIRRETAAPSSPAASAPVLLDAALRWMWISTSVGMLLILALSSVRLRKSSRGWRRQRVDGHEVWVTPNLGPAVVGCIAPRVLLPEWALEVPSSSRRLILTHELQHVAGRDACSLLAGLLVVAVAPWNVFLWWQLRRLRFAIEVDCDARVLARNADARGYGEALLLVAQRALTRNAGFALTEATSHLERRISVLVSRRGKPRWAILAACVGLSLGLVAAAVALTAPSPIAVVLRRPPPEYHNSYLQAAEAAARKSFPELFQGKFDGSVEIQVGLDRNGAVIGVDERQGPLLSARFFGASPWGARRLANPVGWAATHGYEVQDAVIGPTVLLAWHGTENRDKLYLSFDVIKWTYDPTRSAELVRDAVVARYPGTLRARERVDGALPWAGAGIGTGLPGAVDGPQQRPHLMQFPKLAVMDPLLQQHQGREVKLVTVFMNENGTINRSDLREVSVREDEPPRSAAVFAEMGIGTGQLAHRGAIWQMPPGPGEEVIVDYAWPRRADDPVDDADGSIIEKIYGSGTSPADAAWDEAHDRAILSRYFPDLWQGRPPEGQVKFPWILFDRNGNVQATGSTRERAADIPRALLHLPRSLETLYPGVRMGEWIRSPVTSAAGRTVWLTYIWVAPDSPISDLSSFDPATRRNVLVDGDLVTRSGQ